MQPCDDIEIKEEEKRLQTTVNLVPAYYEWTYPLRIISEFC
jgi:hypothetical protein